MQTIELNNVRKSYDQFVAVNNLSFSIPQGGVFGLLGPNGAGKTSTIRMMIGITMPDSGQITLFGKPFERKSLNSVGYLPEERGLYKKMKIIDQLVFFGELHGMTAAMRGSKPWYWCKAAGNRCVAAEESGRAFQGHAAEDPVHRRPAA